MCGQQASMKRMHGQRHRIIGLIALLGLVSVVGAQGEDALNPRTHGDWDYRNSPIPTYRDCHPALTDCQLPVTPVTKGSSTLNKRAVSGKELGTPGSPAPLDDRGTVGPDIGNPTPSNSDDAVRTGPAISR